MERKVKWIEVWADTFSGGLVLYVVRELEDGTVQVLSAVDQAIVDTFASYDEAKVFLGDEDAARIDGRLEGAGYDLLPTDEVPSK